MSRNTLIVLGVVVVAVLLYVTLDWLIVTETEKIEQMVYDGARAVEARDVERIVALFSPNCPVRQTLGEQGFRQEIIRRLEQAGATRCRTTSVGTPTFGPDGNTAKVPITVATTLTGPLVSDFGGNLDYAGRVVLQLEKVGEDWAILSFEVYNLIGGADYPVYSFGKERTR